MKKIMFDDKFGLTKAVLEGRKTMTRRIAQECTNEGRALFTLIPNSQTYGNTHKGKGGEKRQTDNNSL